jgi:hypothetical protein
MDAKVIKGWDTQFESLADRVGGVFPRRNTRRPGDCVRDCDATAAS